VDTSPGEGRTGINHSVTAATGTLEASGLRALDTSTLPDPSRVVAERLPLGKPSKKSGGSTSLRVRIWGARGSVPVSGSEFRRYGGNTPCVEMRCGDHTLLFDAGSGIRPAGVSMLKSGVRKVHLFLTHFHYDHVLGLPFFAPLYDPAIRVEIWSGHLNGIMSTRDMLCALMQPPWFPIEISICRAAVISRDFKSGDVIKPWPDVTVRTGSLNHPGGCIGYRVEFEGRAVALICDTEHVDGVPDANVLALIENADLVIYDAAYTDEEMGSRRGFGHSSWQEGVRLCKAAGAKRLALFHHDPFRTDAELASIEADAKRAFPRAFAARDGQTLTFAARLKARRV
jgi:phosphoribosyl 1,2-cyclic phosphodiesterase